MTAAEVSVGDLLPPLRVQLTRADLVRYAGASGDFNPIHWSDDFATSVGLPGVIAHGMLTMATAIRVVTEWTGDPHSVLEYRTKFTHMVPVDGAEGALLEVDGRVTACAGDTAQVTLGAYLLTGEERTAVLGRARALVRLPR
ncbi:MAG: MaoC/PaaZ C-terminal domain-containing protein [Angustibacter sp.]